MLAKSFVSGLRLVLPARGFWKARIDDQIEGQQESPRIVFPKAAEVFGAGWRQLWKRRPMSSVFQFPELPVWS